MRRVNVALTRPSIVVIKPGLLTTVQDRGRWGYQARGVPVAGPMDPCSHRLANALVGNARDGGGARGHAARPGAGVRRTSGSCAVAGAEFELSRRRRAGRRRHAPFAVAAGSRAALRRARRGARAYLAVAGGIDVPPVLGSRATHLVSAMGGVRRTRAARRRSSAARRSVAGRRAWRWRRRLRSSRCRTAARRVRVLPGPQHGLFRGGRARRAAVGAVRRRRRNRIAWAFASRGRA